MYLKGLTPFMLLDGRPSGSRGMGENSLETKSVGAEGLSGQLYPQMGNWDGAEEDERVARESWLLFLLELCPSAGISPGPGDCHQARGRRTG